jgi:hypothetical protein
MDILRVSWHLKHNRFPLAEQVKQSSGSYAGARAAHMRILYPDLVYGAIASSAVTHAQIEFPEYNEIIRNAAPGHCASHVVNAVNLVDRALSSKRLNTPIKRLFGLEELTEDVEFATVISVGANMYSCLS